jgi:molybdenum cofactor cytidylyltransferase
VRPAIGERHGHPVLFDRAVFAELRRVPLDEGAKAVVHAHADQIVNVSVADEGCLSDVDTPAQYDALMRRPSRNAD